MKGYNVETIDIDIENDEHNSEGLHLHQEVEVNQMGATTSRAKRKKRSKWWAYFDMLPKKEGEPARCKCKACGQIYKADSTNGTGNLQRHVTSSCPRRHTRDIYQALLEQGEKGLTSKPQTFNQEKFRELTILALIKHELPFRFVEYERVRAIFSYLEPQVTHFTRNTAKTDVLKLYKKEMAKLKSELCSCPGRICFTSDLWTSIATDGYLCLTAHFIDSEWNLQKKILSFSYMPPPHSGIALCEKINTLLTSWGIEKKVFTMTLDNASANDVFIDTLKGQLSLKSSLVSDGEFLHIRCCAHVLNLIVQQGLKNIDSSVDKVRECVKYVKGSQVRKQKFLECVSQTSLDIGKSLRQDVPTRWNSTYLMLSCALYYRRAFNHLRLADSNFMHCPTTEEWGKVEKICKLLQIFYETTNLFSGVNYPTSNLYFSQVFLIQLTLSQELISTDSFMSQIASKMLEKYGKYWKDFNLLLALAVIFDPRYKIQFVEFCYNKLYGVGSKECASVKAKLFSIFNEYMKNVTKSTSSYSASTSSSQGIVEDNISIHQPESMGCLDVLKEFDSFQSLEFVTRTQRSQLELYLDEPRIERNAKLDILSFWKAHSFRYPELAQMARDILTVPISTVASESAFSTGGRILDQYRSALKPSVVEALVCCRDWLYGENISTEVKLEELIENIIKLNSHESDAKSSNVVDLDVEC